MNWDATIWLASTRRLQEKSFSQTFPMKGEELANYLMMNHSAAVIELSEFMQEVRWKPWASPRGDVNHDQAVGELVDVMHFLGNLFVALGVTDEELAERYPMKQKINAQRQADGYDGLNKCPGCGRALDEPEHAVPQGDLRVLVQSAGAVRMTETPNWVKSQADHPYTWGQVGPAGYDCSGFLKPTDWNAWIRRDRSGALKALLRLELRYRWRRLVDHLQGHR